VALLLLVLVLITMAYRLGHFVGKDEGIAQQQQQWVDLDEGLLAKLPVRPNTLTSGEYVLETRFAGKPAQTEAVTLAVADGKLAKPPAGPSNRIAQNGNVVSWIQFDVNEGPL